MIIERSGMEWNECVDPMMELPIRIRIIFRMIVIMMIIIIIIIIIRMIVIIIIRIIITMDLDKISENGRNIYE